MGRSEPKMSNSTLLLLGTGLITAHLNRLCAGWGFCYPSANQNLYIIMLGSPS